MGTHAPNNNTKARTYARFNSVEEKIARQKEIDDWLPITSARNAKWYHSAFQSVTSMVLHVTAMVLRVTDMVLVTVLFRLDAKWYHSAFHNVNAMVGAGVLCLPYAMCEIGWGPGVTLLVVSWIITLYTLWQMVGMHVMPPGRHFDRYHEPGQHAFGGKLGLYIVVPRQLVVEIVVKLVYMVTGGLSLKFIFDTVCSDCHMIRLTYFIMIFASACFVRSLFLNFNSRPLLKAKKETKWYW